MINGLRCLRAAHPNVAGRVWFFWSCFYTSSVRMYDLVRECHAHRRMSIKILLGAIVVKCPGCKLAGPALTLLEESFTVYEEGSRLCCPPATVVRNQPLCFARNIPLWLKTVYYRFTANVRKTLRSRTSCICNILFQRRRRGISDDANHIT